MLWIIPWIKHILKRQLYTAYIFRGTRSEPFYGMEAIVPSLYIWRSLFRTSDQAKKLSNMEHDA